MLMLLFKKNLITVSILLSISSFLTYANLVEVPVYVEETMGPDWQSMTIGTTETRLQGNGVSFDHVPPVAKGRRSIAIGTSAVAGDQMTSFLTGEAIAIGSKANAAKEQSVAIGADTKATGWGSVVIGGDDIQPVHGKTYGRLIVPQ